MYSLSKKSKDGRRFGFVRFLDVKNQKELEKHLDQIWINGRKLRVNLTKYPEEDIEVARPMYRTFTSKVTQGKSYAETVQGQTRNDQSRIEDPSKDPPPKIRYTNARGNGDRKQPVKEQIGEEKRGGNMGRNGI